MDIDIKLLLQLLAVAVTIFGFYISKADKIPPVLKVVDKDYLNSINGIKVLYSDKGQLLPADKGFIELSQLIRTKLKPQDKARQAVFEKLQRGPGGLGFSKIGAKSFVQLDVYISGSNPLKYDIQELEKEIKNKSDKKILKLSTIVFWVGVIFSLFLLMVKE